MKAPAGAHTYAHSQFYLLSLTVFAVYGNTVVVIHHRNRCDVATHYEILLLYCYYITNRLSIYIPFNYCIYPTLAEGAYT